MKKSPFVSLALGAWLLAQGGCVVHDTACETDDDCDNGRACNAGLCVGAEAKGNSSGGTGSATNSSGGGPAGGSGTTTAGSGGSGDSGTCTSSSPNTCAGTSSIRTCVEGSYAVVTCADYFGDIGFSSNSCAADKCNVVGTLDAQCNTGAGVVCTCGDGCTDEEVVNLYVGCYLNNPVGTKATLHCLAGYVSGGEVNCTAAQACLEG